MNTDHKLTKEKLSLLVLVAIHSLLLFCATFMLPGITYIFADIQKATLEGRILPPIVTLTHTIMPQDFLQALLMALSFAATHFCLGLILISTSATQTILTRRVFSLISITWALMILSLVTITVLMLLPFKSIISKLSYDGDTESMAGPPNWRAIYSTLYLITLLIITTVICRKQNRASRARPHRNERPDKCL